LDASKLTNGSREEVLGKRSAPPKSVQASAVRSEAKKVGNRATGKKAKSERPRVTAVKKSKSEKLVCRYCGSDDLAPASSSDEIADAANVSGGAMDRRYGLRRRRSRIRFVEVDKRGRARNEARPLSFSGDSVWASCETLRCYLLHHSLPRSGGLFSLRRGVPRVTKVWTM
jgi:hypothetical protein